MFVKMDDLEGAIGDALLDEMEGLEAGGNPVARLMQASRSPAVRARAVRKVLNQEGRAVPHVYYSSANFSPAAGTGVIAAIALKLFSIGSGQAGSPLGFAGNLTDAQTNMDSPGGSLPVGRVFKFNELRIVPRVYPTTIATAIGWQNFLDALCAQKVQLQIQEEKLDLGHVGNFLWIERELFQAYPALAAGSQAEALVARSVDRKDPKFYKLPGGHTITIPAQQPFSINVDFPATTIAALASLSGGFEVDLVGSLIKSIGKGQAQIS